MHNADKIEQIYIFANRMRKMALEMSKHIGKGATHIGGSFSCIEIVATLYAAVMRYDVKDPHWIERDRFIPSKAHGTSAFYPAIACAGFIPEEKIFSYFENGGLLAGRPRNVDIGLEYAGGSLGLGLSVGIGMALSAKQDKHNNNIFVLLGDGECNEGSVWEGFMAAGNYHLDNLVSIIDFNNMQFDGTNEEVMNMYPFADKLKAFGWKTVEVNGHSPQELLSAFEMQHPEQPLAIIAHTIKARGLPSLENKVESHNATLTQSDYDYMIEKMERGVYDRV